jgi:hypothetical protein
LATTIKIKEQTKLQCEKCGRILKDTEFYLHSDGSRDSLCKKCLTMHIDNFDEETYVWVLKRLDFPYIPVEWNTIREREYLKSPNHLLTGLSVLGRYLSKMKLKQFKGTTYADSERLCAEAAEKVAKKKEVIENINSEEHLQKMEKLLEEGKISEAEYKTMTTVADQAAKEAAEREAKADAAIKELEELKAAGKATPTAVPANAFFNDDFFPEEEMPDVAAGLTQEDKIYLANKWGRFYKPAEWINLEDQYQKMKQGFDIQDPDTEAALILICKTYLKMNEAVDSGDLDSFNKLNRTYEVLRKSAKFTASQNKDSKTSNFDAVGQIVAYCEGKGGVIPRAATDPPKDIIDAILKDYKSYVRTLVVEELGFGQQIDNALKKIQIQQEMEQREDEDEDDIMLDDADMMDFYGERADESLEDYKNLGDDLDGTE